jgi:hypothetical protein
MGKYPTELSQVEAITEWLLNKHSNSEIYMKGDPVESQEQQNEGDHQFEPEN